MGPSSSWVPDSLCFAQSAQSIATPLKKNNVGGAWRVETRLRA